ncbi:protein of unknown function [Sporobacter termitidis DSM 10068]|uniref:DUF3841 domain-containing protein n=1 Tax=Sporobacter termitidis DSM 10068 TaxID=1123282 RepID=A0A1M5Z3W0_9FIRM|nr:DUF3841 domain-containing protein [Sporobacter termitidis]SHI18798.1 protein of unknown function [Sporobacter termitidis DSM 10068]
MRIWSIQPEELYEKLKIKKVLYCDPSQSELITECGFGPAYIWLTQQMKARIGSPPEGATYPFWAWHTIEWKHQKPDLRRTEFRAYGGNQVCLELEIPDNMVLLSNEDMWHIVLNDGYYGDCSNDREMEIEDRWFESLPPDKQIAVKVKSWEKIFNVSPPLDNTWESREKYVQATFWELRLDQVAAVRRFHGRLNA